MSTLQEIRSEEEFKSTIATASPSTVVAVSFHTPWAAPCAQMRTILETLAATFPERDPATVSFLSVNAEDLPDVSESYDVTAVPFLVLVRDGRVLETVGGSEAGKVRDAVERQTGKAGVVVAAVPPALVATPRKEDEEEADDGGRWMKDVNGGAAEAMQSQPRPTQSPPGLPAKDLSSYMPGKNDDPPSTAESKAELHARLANLVQAAPVMLFMKGTPSGPECGFSRQMVAILRQHAVKYGFFNILADDDVRQGLKEFADWPTYPQLWVGGELVGGLDILNDELQSNPAFLAEYSASKLPPDRSAAAA